MLKKLKINNQITAPELRVADETGQQIGIMSRDEALKLAQEKGLDLVEFAPMAKPPVARITDYGKYIYREEKEERKQKAKQKKDALKTIRISLNASSNDLKTKAEKTEEFLNEGIKVQVELVLKGRAKYQKVFSDLGKLKVEEFLKLIIAPVKIISELKKQPRGWNMTIVKQ
ncbi:MAG: translation initiation factor IF-3 [Candidatus Azambacteria bacterium]|nr:translation initiation factor IF-3 [Candidatus Azambacteria bacterium]